MAAAGALLGAGSPDHSSLLKYPKSLSGLNHPHIHKMVALHDSLHSLLGFDIAQLFNACSEVV